MQIVAQRLGLVCTVLTACMPEAQVLDGGMEPNPTPQIDAVVIAPDSAFVQAGDSFAFIAYGRMSDGSTTDIALSWSATGGSVSIRGVYRATGGRGKHRVIAKSPGGQHSDTAVVTVDSIAPPPDPTPGTRDPLKWPFAANSIWNMPIGSGAVYVRAGPNGIGNMPGHLPAINWPEGWQYVPGLEHEYIVLRPNAPLTDVMESTAGWSGASRCTATSTRLLGRVPIPTDYIVPSNRQNSTAAFLMPDGHTLVEAIPFTRCTAGGYATAMSLPSSNTARPGIPASHFDLYGDGLGGAHGGSYMSSLGGTLRLGELRPGGQGPRHALKVNLWDEYLLYHASIATDAYRWPAQTADGVWRNYGSLTNNTNTAMKVGVLLAIPASTSIASLGLETEPGKQLAWTLQNYGVYNVDNSAGPIYAIAVEDGADGSFVAQFQADYGFSFEQRVMDNTPWSRDFMKLIEALWVVDNNGPNSIGGGGTPRQPLAPPFQ